MPLSYPLPDVVSISGATRRQIQFWTDNGALVADEAHPGTGKTRHFTRQETAIACVLVPLAEFGIGLGTLIAIANAMRLDRRVFNRLVFSRDEPVFFWAWREGNNIMCNFIIGDTAREELVAKMKRVEDGTPAVFLEMKSLLRKLPH